MMAEVFLHINPFSMMVKSSKFVVVRLNKTYYKSQREIWRDISRAEGISPYLTADECNKCFILRGTSPGSFSH